MCVHHLDDGKVRFEHPTSKSLSCQSLMHLIIIKSGWHATGWLDAEAEG